jgi:hypothetical protein
MQMTISVCPSLGSTRGGIDPTRVALLMFDCETPRTSGCMAGEYFAAAVENHPRYPNLRDRRALLAKIDRIVVLYFNDVVETILPDIGFNAVDAANYRVAALASFRAAIPSQ